MAVTIKHSDEPTTPVIVDLGLLWLMEGIIPQGPTGWIGEEFDGDGLIEQVHHGILFCNDTEETEATLLFTERHCKLISMVVSPANTVGSDHQAGKRLLLKAFQAERTLRYGPDAPIAKDYAPTKARTLEWLKEGFPTDPQHPD